MIGAFKLFNRKFTIILEVYEYFEELDQMNWSARGNVLNQYLRNTSIGTTVNIAVLIFGITFRLKLSKLNQFIHLKVV